MAGKRRQALDNRLTARRQGARVARLFNRLHAHGYVVRSIISCTFIARSTAGSPNHVATSSVTWC